jgi:uncharacterized protein YukJ
MGIKNYGMLKGKLVYGVPYYSSYNANPHYVFVLDTGDGNQPTIVVNSMSSDGTEVGTHSDFSFEDTSLVAQLRSALPGFPTTFPRIDYLRDFNLGDPSNWTPVPYEAAEDGDNNDINDVLSALAEVDTTGPSEPYDFNNGTTTQARKAFKPRVDVTVVAFGQVFPDRSGIHDAHMSQGDKAKKFVKENGIYQDGALFFFVGDAVRAHFTVFSSQYVPTDSRGDALPNATPACPRIKER